MLRCFVMSRNSTFANRRQSLPAFIVYTGICILAIACQSEKSADLKSYPFRGTVVNVNPVARTVMIHHEDIPGYMTSMTMEFRLKDPADYARLRGGDKIEATLVVGKTSSYLENLKITKGDPGFAAPPCSPKTNDPHPGDQVPDVTLINQRGKSFRMHDLRGRRLVITFFYTRCPLPDFCPLMNMNLARIADELDKDPTLARKTLLLSITFDPKFDSPQVLAENLALYRNAKRPGAAQWIFATGKPDQIAKIADFFGVWYKEQPDQVAHNLRTGVVSADGKVEALFPGNQWKSEEVLKILRQP